MKIAIVAPCHIQPSASWVEGIQREVNSFLAERSKQKDITIVEVIIVDDSDGKILMPDIWRVYNYAKQEEFLGDLYPEFARIFHKSSSCRIFGHLVAMQEKFDYIIGLDSDCIVPFNFIQEHIRVIGQNGGYGWTNPISSTGMYSRGFPYSQRNWKIGANMGLWENVLDINGKDRVPNEPRRVSFRGNSVSVGYLPFSGMNFCISGETAPIFLFLPNFNYGKTEFRRIDDIWGGYIYQKLLHKLHQSVSFGSPTVFHDTVVVASEDAAEEAGMYEYEDRFIDMVDITFENTFFGLKQDSLTPNGVMTEFIFELGKNIKETPFAELDDALGWWLDAIEKYA